MEKYYCDKFSDVVFMQADCAAILLKEHGEEHVNAGLYHLSVVVKLSLRIICEKYKISFANDDSMAFLFDKTYKHLPSEILDMVNDICYWHDGLQYEAFSIKTNDEAMQAGKTIQAFYNEYITQHIHDLLWTEAGTAAGIKPLALL